MDTILKSIDSEKPMFVRGAAACQLATFSSINHQQILTKPTIMKKISILLFLAILCSVAHAQVQRGFSFQGYARNVNGAAYASQKIEVQFKIYEKSKSAEYTETHTPTTDEYGLFQLFVGSGTVVSGNFNNLNFGAKDYWLRVEVRSSGTNNAYEPVSDTQLAAVPYAKAADNGVPPGTILAFAGAPSAVPAGYLLCDGALVSGNTYPNLFNAIGTVWGGGNGSFNVPDLRGVFLRGASNNVNLNRDPNFNRTVGSYQGDDTAPHTHTGTTNNSGRHTHSSNATADRNNNGQGLAAYDGTNTTSGLDNSPGEINLLFTRALVINDSPEHTHTFTTSSSGTDGRPKNFAVNYIIKF